MESPSPPDEPIGRREAGKEERRRRIITAARELIRESGSAGLSMRELAKRADVSVATPYNLFGSKGAIILAVLQDAREFHHRFAEHSTVDAITKIFDAVDLAIEFYVRDPDFYRVLWREVFSAISDVRAAIYNPKRDAFWRGLLLEAAAIGAFRPAIDPELLLHQLDHQFRSVMLDWVSADLADAALAPTIRLGYGLVLLGAADAGWRGPLEARVAADQRQLQELGSSERGRPVAGA